MCDCVCASQNLACDLNFLDTIVGSQWTNKKKALARDFLKTSFFMIKKIEGVLVPFWVFKEGLSTTKLESRP